MISVKKLPNEDMNIAEPYCCPDGGTIQGLLFHSKLDKADNSIGGVIHAPYKWAAICTGFTVQAGIKVNS